MNYVLAQGRSCTLGLLVLVKQMWWRCLSSLLVTGDYSTCKLQGLTILLMLYTTMVLLNYLQPLILIRTTRGTETDHYCGERSAAAMRGDWTCRKQQQQQQPRTTGRAWKIRTAREQQAEEDKIREEKRTAGEAGEQQTRRQAGWRREEKRREKGEEDGRVRGRQPKEEKKSKRTAALIRVRNIWS
jgi:hypothetical protein